MEILIKGAQLILSLSILVVLHEMGHFLPARWFKTRVEKFYLFFDPWFSLVKKKIGDTEYGIGWLPLGGYVKISGMVDESMDKDQMAKPPQPWEFRSKPAWQRLIIMVGGVTVNLLLGMAIYIGILYTWGRDTLPLDSMVYGVHASPTMQAMGVQDGDKIVRVGTAKPATLEDVHAAIMVDDARELTLDRNGTEVKIELPGNYAEIALNSNETILFTPRFPFYIDTLVKGQNAASSTLRKGDRVLAVDGTPTPFFADFPKALKTRKGEYVFVTVERNGALRSSMVKVADDGTVGVGSLGDLDSLVALGHDFKVVHEDYSLLGSIPAGIKQGWDKLGKYAGSLKLLFTPSGASQIGGFGTIGGLFSPEWDWQVFWHMTAFLSIILAFMNILPIPALDGGHVVFLLYEIITRRPPNQRVLEVAQMVGMVLLIGLIVFANGNDIFKRILGG